MKIMEAPHPKWGDMANRLGPASQALAAHRFFSSSAEEGQHAAALRGLCGLWQHTTPSAEGGQHRRSTAGLGKLGGVPPSGKTFNLHPT